MDQADAHRTLILSVVHQAIWDAVGKRPNWGTTKTKYAKQDQGRAKQEWKAARKEARLWLLDERNPTRAFSFDWCAEVLGLNATTIRQRVEITMGLRRATKDLRPYHWT